MLMLLPRFRRPRLRPDVVSDGPSNEVFTPEESSQPPGPASRQHPSECFHSKNSSGPFTAGFTVH